MRWVPLAAAAALLCLASCSSTETSGGSAAQGGGHGGATGAGGDSAGGGPATGSGTGGDGTGGNGTGGNGTGGSGTGGTGGATALPTCYPTCTSPSDCVGAGATPILDADNYACDSGKCRWLGCNTTAECTAAYMSPDYVCATAPGTTFKSCYPTCTTPSDCVTAGAPPILDADNYVCTGGRCEWLGCNTTAECTATFMSPSYVCAAPAGSVYKSCYPTCATAADCVTAGAPPILDADNYACDGGRCEWLGCNSTAECTATYMSQGYVCD